MEQAEFNFSYKVTDVIDRIIPLKTGDIIFVIGANGSGKSVLMTHLSGQNLGRSKRIVAHRQTWFTNNALDLTPISKIQTENNMRSKDTVPQSRWIDHFLEQRTQIIIFDLINSENVLARKAHLALKKDDDYEEAKKLARLETPLESLNEILFISNLPIKIFIGDNGEILASKYDGEMYSIAQLSDGERNALLIISDVLTAKPDTLFIIDEPERHLHRSIISPMLSALFNKRKDCAFVIATHDIGLVLDNPHSSILLVRSCRWGGGSITGWDANLISATDEIDYQIKKDILGARRKILFVEGNENSLDKSIYTILYPEVSVIPVGDCKEVEKAVAGIRKTESLNWLQVFGLIDADDRSQEEIEKLKDKNIFALPCYSVEALYYSSKMIEKIAELQALNNNQRSKDGMINLSKKVIIDEMTNLKEELCARVCERKVRYKIGYPTRKDIKSGKSFEIKINLQEELNNEISIFENFISEKKVDDLVGRYPLKNRGILNKVAQTLGYISSNDYEGSVRTLLLREPLIQNDLRNQISALTEAIETESHQ